MKMLGSLLLCFLSLSSIAQQKQLFICNQFGSPIKNAIVQIQPLKLFLVSDSVGNVHFVQLDSARQHLRIQALGYEQFQTYKHIASFDTIRLKDASTALNEVVIGVERPEDQKSYEAFSTDILQAKFFRKTTSASLFEAAALVPGIRAQVNCNVCNTGELRINGMDGPYTLVMIDNIPVISALSGVYGLMGIPASLIENVEISKGPSSAFYSSEAMAGSINIITKHANEAEPLALDYNVSTYNEHQLDIAAAKQLKRNRNVMAAINVFNYQTPVDLNKDNFTDISLQQRGSVFLKLTNQNKPNRASNFALRGFYEDRWGGEMNWSKQFRAGDSIYGESIYIKRLEAIGNKMWGAKSSLKTDYSLIYHHQDAAYGTTSFIGTQVTAYTQTYMKKQINETQHIEAGHTVRYMWYDDNTAATQSQLNNIPENTFLSGIYVQHTITSKRNDKLSLSSGIRFDWHSVYGGIPTPRMAFKWKPNPRFCTRINVGTGYRVVNVFTEDHAALSGARKVVFLEQIKPERSASALINSTYKMALTSNQIINWDLSVFYYHFYNKISANYEQQGLIIYKNLTGHAYSRGVAITAAYPILKGLNASLSYNFTDVQLVDTQNGKNIKQQQWYSPKHSALFSVSYFIKPISLKLDFTGSYTGAQRLPIQTNDYRKEYAPSYMLLNLLASKTFSNGLEVYAGVKNLLDYLPSNPLMRPFDPFNKTADDLSQNPNAYVFDTTYNYAAFQRRRCTVGVRFKIKQKGRAL